MQTSTHSSEPIRHYVTRSPYKHSFIIANQISLYYICIQALIQQSQSDIMLLYRHTNTHSTQYLVKPTLANTNAFPEQCLMGTACQKLYNWDQLIHTQSDLLLMTRPLLHDLHTSTHSSEPIRHHFTISARCKILYFDFLVASNFFNIRCHELLIHYEQYIRQ